MRSRPLTRRTFLGALGAGALTLLAACRDPQPPRPSVEDPARPEPMTPAPAAPTPPPAEPTLRIGATGGDALAAAVAWELRGYLAQQLPGHAVEWGEEGSGETQVLVTGGAPAAAARYERRKLTRLFAPVTNWRLPVRYLERAEFSGVFGGAITDWSEVGSPLPGAIAILAFTPAGAPPLPDLPQPAAPVAAYDDYEALVAGLDEHPFGVALAPLDAIDFRVQALPIDDLDPLAGRGDLAAYPLKHDLWLSWAPTLGGGLRDALNAFALTHGFGDGDAVDPVAGRGAPVNLTIAGDIIFGRVVHEKMVEYGDWAYPLRGVAPRLRAADLTIADLECSLSDNTKKPIGYTFLFTTNAAAVEGLTLAGIDGVSLANNHSMNFGTLGLVDTLDVLDQHGITPFGAGADLAAARQPGIFTVKGLTLAVLGYDGITPDEYGAGPDWAGTCPLDRALLVEDIAAAKAAGADLVIPFFHWSEEYVAVPSAAMRRVAHEAIDAGAGLVVGSHPHWVQGVEWYRGAPILYSLGNFVFDQEWSLETKQGMFTEIVLRGGKPVRVRLVPVLIEDYSRPRILNGAEALAVLNRVYDASDVIKGLG